MRFLVCMKQSVDTSKMEVDPGTGRLKRNNANSIINPMDLNALEAALSCKDRLGGTVTVITMGPPQAEAVLKEAMARGADEFYLLTDSAFGGADTLATAYTLSRLINHIQSFDIIFFGQESIDGGTAQVGPEVASMLGLPDASGIVRMEADPSGKIHVARIADQGEEELEIHTPCVLTCTAQLNHPRYPSIKGILAKDDIHVHTMTSKDLDFDPSRIGLKGSPTSVKQVRNIVHAAKENLQIQGKSAEESVNELVQALQKINAL